MPASAASFDWSISEKNLMPFAAMSFFSRSIVSTTEYALFTLTIPSSALVAAAEVTVRANANRTAEDVRGCGVTWVRSFKIHFEHEDAKIVRRYELPNFSDFDTGPL